MSKVVRTDAVLLFCYIIFLLLSFTIQSFQSDTATHNPYADCCNEKLFEIP